MTHYFKPQADLLVCLMFAKLNPVLGKNTEFNEKHLHCVHISFI
jgi:hypothetical protein